MRKVYAMKAWIVASLILSTTIVACKARGPQRSATKDVWTPDPADGASLASGRLLFPTTVDGQAYICRLSCPGYDPSWSARQLRDKCMASPNQRLPFLVPEAQFAGEPALLAAINRSALEPELDKQAAERIENIFDQYGLPNKDPKFLTVSTCLAPASGPSLEGHYSIFPYGEAGATGSMTITKQGNDYAINEVVGLKSGNGVPFKFGPLHTKYGRTWRALASEDTRFFCRLQPSLKGEDSLVMSRNSNDDDISMTLLFYKQCWCEGPGSCHFSPGFGADTVELDFVLKQMP